jgi:hypothetical protein
MRSPASPTTSRGSLAFRIFGWLLGIGTILFSLVFVILSLVTDDPIERTHRFHYLAVLIGSGLIGVFSVLWVLSPERTSYFQALVAQALAWLIGGLMGGDLVSGLYITGVAGLVILTALHPDPRPQMRLRGGLSVAMLTYSMITAVPAWIYAVEFADLQHGPSSDPHVQMHHWSGIAVAALAIIGAEIAASLRGDGWTVTAAIASAAAVLFGFAGLVFQDYPGAPETGWSWIAIAAGIGFWLVSRIEWVRDRRGS